MPLNFFLPKNLRPLLFFCLPLTFGLANAQFVTVKGTVYNMNRTKPLEAVSVVSSSGNGTITDSNGIYSIIVKESDSISFSYLGRKTIRYPVRMILSYNSFDIALHVQPTELRQIQIAPRDYHMDSLQNRKDYAKIFDYHKPKLKLADANSGEGVGLDLDEIINMFRFNQNRRMLAFQQRLLQEEKDKFVDHRFTRALVKKYTKLNGPDLDSFMIKYRPSYNFTKSASDYDFGEYIKLAAKNYMRTHNRTPTDLKNEKAPF